jgi:hypothetical protein
MTRTRVRWSDLGSPTEAGTYRYGVHLFDVMLGDIERANGNPDAVFTAIHPDFYSSDAPSCSPTSNSPARSCPYERA